MESIVLKNGLQSVTFARVETGYRPEWFREGERPMLRFKDHEFLNIGCLRITEGQCLDQSETGALFGGEVLFADVRVGWSVRVSIPDGGQTGFVVTTKITPLQEPIELLEAMSAFELPYEYDGSEHQMTYMGQQPIYRFEGDKEITGAGFKHPNWYYGRPGRAHLTFRTQSPVMCCRVANPDGGNQRCTTVIGNFNVCSAKDLFAQPTRPVRDLEVDIPFPDPALNVKVGQRGRKFLIGAINWNVSLYKDPNVLVEVEKGLAQEVLVDFASEMPGGQWDAWMAVAWGRMMRLHFPADGRVPAWEIAKSRGASWIEAAEWLTEQFKNPDGCEGFFSPEKGTCVYSPQTRPGSDKASGVPFFCGQWIGPVSYLAHVWDDEAMEESVERLEALFLSDEHHQPETMWTVGPTTGYLGALRRASVKPLSEPLRVKTLDYLRRRAAYVLDPPPGARTGDAGMFAIEAVSNLLAADIFDREEREQVARRMLDRINRQLDVRFESFNCAAEGDDVGAHQGRPFGHGLAMTANLMAHQRFGDEKYRKAAGQCGHLMMALYYAGYNNAESPDLDSRGWAIGANGGRDQLCDMPPWETSFALQQLAYAIQAGITDACIYDLFWLFAHTGLAMFPKARAFKRLYTPGMGITYREVDTLPTERKFYLSLPYLAYEEPWDQTMLAGYQGVEPIILSLLLGGGVVGAEDDRVLALVPQTATYDPAVPRHFVVHLWNPLDHPIWTRLRAEISYKRGACYDYSGPVAGTVKPSRPWTEPVVVPPREVTRVEFVRV